MGLVIAPTADLLCSFPADSGTGGHPNGRCDETDRATVGLEKFYRGGGAYQGHTLRDALEQQYNGSYRASHWGASGYNEAIIGSMYWERNLPWVVEAFMYAESERMTTAAQKLEIRRAHGRFLSFYGLTPEEVPLLEYVCFVPPLDAVKRPAPCFVDVS